jgi:capsular polysaccharide export protein
MRAEDLPPLVYAFGLSGRKAKILGQFACHSRIRRVSSCAGLRHGSTLILWGGSVVPADCPEGIKVVRIEDGFLRSVGLGVDLIKPVSWVFDSSGIYFDATDSSDLEQVLATTDFSAKMIARAGRFRKRIVSCNVTKYNVGNGEWRRPSGVQKIILVPGQVESDASICFGAPGIATNMGLLRRVREANPEAYLLYKPHPDVLAGLRLKGQNEDMAMQWCNEQLTDIAMGTLLPLVDEVHVMTSLAGFEALMRGKKVTCHGQPFYAGWGLTTDILPISRRIRTLTLDELVCGALILYPMYISRCSGTLTTPEQALDALLAWSQRDGFKMPWWRRLFRTVRRHIEVVR